MMALFAAIAVALIFAGGAVSVQDFGQGLLVMGLGAGILGFLFAAVQYGAGVYGFSTQDGLTIRQLKSAILPCPDDMKVYVGDAGVNAAGSMFQCRLDGKSVFVIERGVEAEVPTPTNMYVRPNDSLF